MNNSINLSASASHHSVRLQRVLATTLADWGRPLPGNIDLDAHDMPFARRRHTACYHAPVARYQHDFISDITSPSPAGAECH
jgi:hypothetical protein